VVLTFAVVAFSVFIQGLTITPLLRRLGQLPPQNSGRARESRPGL
jgi:NhaP-type Na+/H+ or K+/H+ antiporter